MSSNRTHRTRLARALAAMTDVPYQAALARVVAAGDTGRLPARLDGDGLRLALDLLLADTPPVDEALQPRYYRLAELPGVRLTTTAAKAIDAARARGVAAATARGAYDVAEILRGWGIGDDDHDGDSGWWPRVAAAGMRADAALPCPYPPSAEAEPDPDGYLPIDRALEQREATGDVDAYEQALHRIVAVEPRDVDAHAHLGHLYLAMADPASTELVFTREPTGRQRQAWLRAALGHYLAGVGVAELALPDPFAGVLPWTELDNRPFLRALHGLTLALWRLQRFPAAELTAQNMLWLNPLDNQGASELLPAIAAGQRWQDAQ